MQRNALSPGERLEAARLCSAVFCLRLGRKMVGRGRVGSMASSPASPNQWPARAYVGRRGPTPPCAWAGPDLCLNPLATGTWCPPGCFPRSCLRTRPAKTTRRRTGRQGTWTEWGPGPAAATAAAAAKAQWGSWGVEWGELPPCGPGRKAGMGMCMCGAAGAVRCSNEGRWREGQGGAGARGGQGAGLGKLVGCKWWVAGRACCSSTSAAAAAVAVTGTGAAAVAVGECTMGGGARSTGVAAGWLQ